MPFKMERIAFYGKGGIGKSTIAAGTSLAMASKGHRVLHVGCDPKHDSTLTLTESGKGIRTVIDMVFSVPTGGLKRESLISRGKFGIDCIESGGPEAGVGCGGRAVSRMFELFDELGVVDAKLYDVAVFDVLGDVVCGGFAAPLRRSVAPKVVIVLSEEMMSVYAANNISKAVLRYKDNGVCLAGLVVNRRDNNANLDPVKRFAEKIGVQILAILPRDPMVTEAEVERFSLVERKPDSSFSREIIRLADCLRSIQPCDCPDPKPLDLESVRQVLSSRR
jgi:nitrogenase iron protein NifH